MVRGVVPSKDKRYTHIVLGLLVFVALLVGSGLLLVWLTLLLAQGLPSVTEDLADLT